MQQINKETLSEITGINNSVLDRHFRKPRGSKDILKSIADAYIQPSGTGRKVSNIDNSFVYSYLSCFHFYTDCHYRMVDDVLTGVSRLDMQGNTRDLSKYLLFNFLSCCQVINTAIIRDYLGIGVRQSQRLYKALVIANRAIHRELLIMFPIP